MKVSIARALRAASGPLTAGEVATAIQVGSVPSVRVALREMVQARQIEAIEKQGEISRYELLPLGAALAQEGVVVRRERTDLEEAALSRKTTAPAIEAQPAPPSQPRQPPSAATALSPEALLAAANAAPPAPPSKRGGRRRQSKFLPLMPAVHQLRERKYTWDGVQAFLRENGHTVTRLSLNKVYSKWRRDNPTGASA